MYGYFSESPFFDHTSNNGVLWGQALNDQSTLALYSDRARLEQTLKSRPGVEYMIVGEPQPVEDQSNGPDSGIWVLRKQDRVKRGPREDELSTLGTYYIAGQNIYQAPAVYDVVGNHLLSAMTSLTRFMEEAAPLTNYAPSTGHSWFPPVPASNLKLDASRAGELSREESVAVGSSSTLQPDTSLEASTQTSAMADVRPTAHDPRDSALLEESLRLTMAYGDEFMDENPLRGEPGNFVFTYTRDHLKARQKEAETAAAKAKEKAAAEKAKAAPAAFTTKAEKDDDAPIIVAVNKRKSSKAEAKRRRKSRAAISVSGIGTPSAMASPEA